MLVIGTQAAGSPLGSAVRKGARTGILVGVERRFDEDGALQEHAVVAWGEPTRPDPAPIDLSKAREEMKDAAREAFAMIRKPRTRAPEPAGYGSPADVLWATLLRNRLGPWA